MIAPNTQAQRHKRPLNILHLEDSELDHALACRELAKSDGLFSATRVDTLPEFLAALATNTFDVVVADFRLPGFTALDAWAAMPQEVPRLPFVLLSGAIGETAAVEAIHLGISDYLHKDELAKLPRVIDRSLEVHDARMAELAATRDLATSQQRLAQFAEHLQASIENERASIAREIHDDIGGSLAAARLDLAWLSRHTADIAAQGHISSANEMLEHALGASQRIMMDLRPAILDQGLFPALQWLAFSFEKRTGIKARLTTNNECVAPDRAVQLVAYRTAQEALTNVSKHTTCTKVRVDLSDAESVLTVEVSDNGNGISDTDMRKQNSFGLQGLQERAKTVGGWLDISSSPGKGTSIILSVPLAGTPPLHGEEHFQ